MTHEANEGKQRIIDMDGWICFLRCLCCPIPITFRILGFVGWWGQYDLWFLHFAFLCKQEEQKNLVSADNFTYHRFDFTFCRWFFDRKKVFFLKQHLSQKTHKLERLKEFTKIVVLVCVVQKTNGKRKIKC